MQTINKDQYDYLKGFFNSLWCSYHHKSEFNANHWANILDDAGIPWHVQNTVSALAHKRENNGFYLSTLLKQNNITIGA